MIDGSFRTSSSLAAVKQKERGRENVFGNILNTLNLEAIKEPSPQPSGAVVLLRPERGRCSLSLQPTLALLVLGVKAKWKFSLNSCWEEKELS